jgi:aspartyl-tRNA(Asn)/glutamyl-tRNA(Gln) amidotransferase subunit A
MLATVSAPVAPVRIRIVSYYMLDPAEPTVARAARAIAGGELSPLELTNECLARAAELEPVIKAFLTLDADGAREQARSLTEELSRSGPRGPLHGVPIAIKDLIDVANLPTTAASRVLAGNIATSDATIVARLRAKGAVIVGKTNTQEFAYGVISSPTRNPADPGRIPGGSSGGSAAAVAAGMCLGALGTDTAGSIRIPAALCGVAGLKPHPGVLPMDGIIPLAPSLDVCGPIARTVEDLGILWTALSGAALPAAPRASTLRVAAPDPFSEVVELDDEVEAALDGALADLTGAGAEHIAFDLPRFEEWDGPRSVPMMMEALEVHRTAGWYPDRADDYTPETLTSLQRAERFTEADLRDATAVLEGLIARLLAVFRSADVLVLPVTPIPAPTVEEAGEQDEGLRRPVTRALTRICGPISACGLAAIAVPCGRTVGGLPIGMQIVARDEATALGAALLYESLRVGL